MHLLPLDWFAVLKIDSECNKTAQLHNMYDYECPVVRRELFSSDKMQELMASVFQLVCYIPNRMC